MGGTRALVVRVADAWITPRLDWSARRLKVVFAAPAISALAGGMIVGLLTMTREYSPDPRFAQPARAATASKSASPTTIVPWVGGGGQLGVMTGGSF
jgi:hypothetical protein